jgi:putative transcriptional regulator
MWFLKKLLLSPAASPNWEQGRRKPTGPAKVLLKVADRHPKLLLETVR